MVSDRYRLSPALLHGSNLMLFGGTGVPFGEAACNNLHICNLNSLIWQHVACEGEPPIRLYGHVSFACLVRWVVICQISTMR